MRKLAFVIMLFSVLLFSAVAWAVDPNPAEYTINVHVSSSRVVETSCIFNQELDVVIEGKRVRAIGYQRQRAVGPRRR
jgi:type 1 fimbria pilin